MEVNPDILKKYYAGNCTPDEKKAVEEWLANDEFRMPPLAMQEQPDEDADLRMRRFLAENTGVDMLDGVGPTARKGVRHLRVWLTTAVAVAACIVLFLGFPKLHQDKSYTVAYSENWLTYKTNPGQKADITLSDGTVVSLNSGSTLYYPKNFLATDSIRLVKLEGEAFFEVEHDSSHPFVISSAKQGLIRVLGTSFNVRAYAKESEVEVAVRTGKVYFGNTEHVIASKILTAGQVGLYSTVSQAIDVSEVAAQNNAWAWKEGKLAFRSEKLRDVLHKIERWYGLTIELKRKSLANAKYTGVYAQPKISELMDNMSFAMGFQYTIDAEKRKIVIY